MRCCSCSTSTAIKIAINKIDDLLMALSSSTAIVGVSDELLESIAVDLEHLPLLDPRVKELNREEPVRLKLTCIKAKLINTRARVTNNRPHEPGRDYSARNELLADLAIFGGRCWPTVASWPRTGCSPRCSEPSLSAV